MRFWKKKKTNEVITNDCFQKLTPQQKQHFEQTNTVPTHKIEENSGDDSGGFALALTATGILMSDSGLSANVNTSFEGFGGGSGGGAGAGSDWGPSDSGSSSMDSGSSFDSGSSSMDSGSSFDSGSSSFDNSSNF